MTAPGADQGRFDSNRTWYVDEGRRDGVPVLLAHGVGLDHTMWDAVAGALTAEHRVVRYDMLGHGHTPPLARQPTLDDFHRQALTLLDALALDTVVFVGFSMGGVIARSIVARDAGRLRGVGLMCTNYRCSAAESEPVLARLALTEREGMEPVTAWAIERWFPPAFQAAQPDAVDAVRRRMLGNDLRGYTAAYRVLANTVAVPGALARFAKPALVLAGGDDLGATPEMARTMAAELPDAELVILEGLRHMAYLEDPPAVNRALARFLRRFA